ncbi:NADH:flavin oxidoreductase/NADH oxidase [Metabacillus fastidiosus]|uniref:NADH:flavin oxidoreductase/NADH oxidase n=1 Tax=Metabacillus fastidiosus TaxID=1458 RepID=UPI003D26F9D9
MPNLMNEFTLKNMTIKNRVMMSPMCQFSAIEKDGMPTDWHLHHYTSRAIGGVGIVMVEMTNIEERGRVTDYCLGIWSDEHRDAFKPIVEQAHTYGAKIGIQIAHAGRKAENEPQLVAPSAIAFDDTYKTPKELTIIEIKELVQKFKEAAIRATEAGFDLIELHGAHGYLIHQFLSPYTNKRSDEYGKDRTLFGVEVIKAIKSVIPYDMPLLLRISGMEYVNGGYDIDEAVRFSKIFKEAGVDAFDVSSGGEGPIDPAGKPGTHGGYQVPLARRIKKELQVPVIAVGRLENAVLANAVIGNHEADIVAIGRGLLANPYWTLQAASQLKLDNVVPPQYITAF